MSSIRAKLLKQNGGSSVTDNDDVIRVLVSIDRRLALLTAHQEREMRREVEQGLLRSEGRTKMFDAIDGRRTSEEIAAVAGVSKRAAQLFVKELQDAGLARDTGTGTRGSVIVELDDEALVQWFVARVTSGADTA